MKRLLIIQLLLLFISVSLFSQGFAIKKWKDRYPTMNNDYPLAFVCWKGWLPPIPHFFTRLYPSHYYYYLNSYPVYDLKAYADVTINDGLKLILKELDRGTIAKSLEEISGIQLNQLAHENLERLLRNSRLKELPDIYQSAIKLQECRQAFLQLESEDLPEEIFGIYRKIIAQKLETYVMINLMDSEQGDKLKAFEKLNQDLRELKGSLMYLKQKAAYYQSWNKTPGTAMIFLSR